MDIIINAAAPSIVTATTRSHSGAFSDISKAAMAKVASSGPTLTAVVSSFSPAAANIKQAVTELNDHVQTLQRSLEFSADNGLMVVRVVDTETNKVISQMPTQAALDLAKSINEDNNNTGFHIFTSKA
jgi:flagellar protein FlaG